MVQNKIAPHEAFELHELLSFKNVCLTKSTTMSGLVSDEKLKSILQQDITLSQGHVKELKSLMENSNMSSMTGSGSTM